MNIDHEEIETLLELCQPMLCKDSTWLKGNMNHSLYLTLMETYPNMSKTDLMILIDVLIKLNKSRKYYFET